MLKPFSWNPNKWNQQQQEMRLTAAIDGLDLSPDLGCVTPTPKNITGSWNSIGGLNIN